MIGRPDRREFLAVAGSTAAASALNLFPKMLSAAPGENGGRLRKAVKYHMIDEDRPVVGKFKLLQDLGFDGVEIRTRDELDREEVLQARQETGLPIHGVINAADPDIRGAVDLAKYYGGTSVLVVAGRVTADRPYDENWTEWQNRLKEAAPYAEEQGILLLVENVWNNFLLSPLEMREFIDRIDSPAVGVYFDVGNVVRFGWPEQWIRILGHRIKKLDIKEYSREKQRHEGLWKGFDVKIGEGSVDWTAVREALKEIGFSGWATAEVGGGDRQRLADIAERMDRVLRSG